MKKLLNKYIIALLALVMAAPMLTSCVDEGEQQVVGVGQNRFRSPAGKSNLIAFDAVVQTRTLIELYRDVVNNAELNKSASVNFTLDQAVLDAYNEAEETELIMLPASNYSFRGVEGNTVNYAAGEFAKDIQIELNPTGLDFSKSYALAFRFENPSSGYGISATSNEVVVQVTVKNDFDGIYKFKIGQAGWTAFTIYEGPPVEYPGTISLSTSGATTVNLFNDYTGTNLWPGFSAGTPPAATQFGAITAVITFDDAGKIVSIANPIADSRNRRLELNPAATASQNQFNFDDKSFTMNVLFKQTGRPDMTVIVEATYVGPR